MTNLPSNCIYLQCKLMLITMCIAAGAIMDDESLVELVKGVAAAEENENGPSEKTGEIEI